MNKKRRRQSIGLSSGIGAACSVLLLFTSAGIPIGIIASYPGGRGILTSVPVVVPIPVIAAAAAAAFIAVSAAPAVRSVSYASVTSAVGSVSYVSVTPAAQAASSASVTPAAAAAEQKEKNNPITHTMLPFLIGLFYYILPLPLRACRKTFFI